MKKIPVRTYARHHKLSLFQVIKKINAGELQGEVTEENGRKVQYVLVEEELPPRSEEKPREETPAPHSSQVGQEAMLLELKQLRIEMARLRQLVERCCEKSGEDSSFVV